MPGFNNVKRSSPILTLANFIASEHSGKSLISFPSGTTDAVTRSRTSRSRYPAAQVASLVQAIDGQAYEFCSSIDHEALLILCSIFTYAEPCQAANRGFCLIAQSLHSMPDDNTALADLKATNKSELRVTLPFLLKGFSQLRENEQTRRWMGVLALELLEDCPDNVEILRSEQDQEWLGISEVIKHGNGEILRLLAGSIVKRMISHNIPPEALWMPQDIPIWFNKFPLAARRDSQWIDDYDRYLQDMATISNQERSNVFFAVTATIGDNRYGIQNKTVIFVTASDSLLQVYVKPPRSEHATYVDIPLVSIANNGLEISDIVQADGSITLLVKLESSTGATHYVDADVRDDTKMEFTFKSKKAALQLMHLLSAKTTVDLDASIAHQPKSVEQVSDEVASDPDEQVAIRNTRHATQRPDYSDLVTIAVQATSSITEEQRPHSSSAGLPKPQPTLQNGQLVSLRRRRLDLTRMQNSGAGKMPGGTDSIDVSALRYIEAPDARNSMASPLHLQRDSTSVEDIGRGLNAANEVTTYLPGESLRSIAERKSAMYIPVHARETLGPRLPKPSQLPQDDNRKRHPIASSNERENRQGVPAKAALKLISTKPQDRLKPSGAVSKTKSKNVERQTNVQMHATHESGKRNDPYDIPKSSPVLAGKATSPKQASKIVSRVTSKTQKVGKAANKFRTETKSSRETDATAEAPMDLTQPRSRRAAALIANRKIQGFDTFDEAVDDPGEQQTLNRTMLMPMAIDKSKAHTIHARDGHFATKDVESDDEAKAAVEESTHDRIEKVAETNASNARRDRARTGVLSPSGATLAAEKGAKLCKAVQEHDYAKTVKHYQTQSGILHKDVFPQGGDGTIGTLESSVEFSTTHVPKTIKAKAADEEEFSEDEKHRQQDVPISQPTQHIRASKALRKYFKVQPFSKAPIIVDKAKPVVPKANRQGSQQRSSGLSDPFASKLNAVVTNRGGNLNHDSNVITSSARNEARNKLMKDDSSVPSGQAIQRMVKRRSETPFLQNITETGVEPPKRSKRKAPVEAESISKKAMAVPQDRSASNATQEKTPPPAFRKTSIISFGTSGPRNQGTSVTPHIKKPALRTSVANIAKQSARAVVPIYQGTETGAIAAQAGSQRRQRRPRKHGSENEMAYYTLAEPQPLPTVDEKGLVEPQGTRATRSSILDKITNKQSSQTTRVNHNGSPMPVHHPANGTAFMKKYALPLKDDERIEEGERYGDGDQQSYDGGEPDLSDDEEDEQILQASLPSSIAILQPSMPQNSAFSQVNVFKNKKQIPSSPTAPSAASALTVHHEYQTGEMVDPRTEESIVPADPQDPFIGQASEYSTFTQLLQKASMTGTKRPAEHALDTRAKKARVSYNTSVLEDPDKTLVEPTPKCHKTNLDIVEESSSSESSNTSFDEDESTTLTEKKTEDTPSQWRKALKPHQRKVLDVLIQISHRLLARMVKSEDAILDVINDFRRSGNLLIDHLEREHQAKFDADAKYTTARAQKLIKLYQETCANLKTEATRVTGQTKRLEAEWKNSRQSSSALAACAV